MTSWSSDKTVSSPDVTADAAVTTPAVTPFCDEWCLMFGDQRLHTIACDIANHRDPILPSHMELEDAVRETPYYEPADHAPAMDERD